MSQLDNNAMAASNKAVDNNDDLPVKIEQELQALYLQLAQAEKDFHEILQEKGILGKGHEIKEAINEVNEDGNRQALTDYYEHSFEEREGEIKDLFRFTEMSKWMGTSRQRARQISGEALMKIRKNPSFMRMFSDTVSNEDDRLLYNELKG